MTTASIPVRAITGLRLTCRRCGAAAVLPMSAKDAPAKCFNCYTELPGPELVRGLVRELRWIQETVRDADVSFDASIEHRKTDHHRSA
jgi:hypothetical protein